MLKKYIVKQTSYVNNATVSCMVSCFEQKRQKESKNKAKSQNMYCFVIGRNFNFVGFLYTDMMRKRDF